MKTKLRDKHFTFSNILTASRLFFAPAIVMGLLYAWYKLVFVFFVTAAATDFLDGYLARLWKEESALGAYLDPIADKVLLLSCFITLAYTHFSAVPLPWWFVGLALLRELVIVGGAIVVVLCAPGANVAPTMSGKLTTCGYIFLIMWLFLCHFFSWVPLKTFTVALFSVSALALYSLLEYLWRGIRRLSR